MRRPGSPSRSAWHPGRRGVLAALLALATLPMVSCGDGCCPPPTDFPALPECLNGASGAVALAVGARANQPAPQLPNEVRTLVLKASYASKPVSVVRVDGDPKRVGGGAFASGAQNDIAWRRDLDNYLTGLEKAISQVRADKPEANPLEALARAGDEAGEGGTVVLIDSGLQTMAPLDFRRTGLIDADAVEVVDFLEKIRQLPHLSGKTVVLAGLGKTADPQQSLDTARRENLIAIWHEIATRAGARCVHPVSETQQGQGAALTGVPQVGMVTVPPPPNPPVGCQESVLDDAGSVKFRPDLAEFVNESEAAKSLQAYADRIKAGHLKVKLIGTTSSAGNSDERKRLLSRQRAEAVKRILVQLTVPAEDITTDGVGRDFPGFVNDRDASNNLVPELAARNRNVIVQLTGCVTS